MDIIGSNSSALLNSLIRRVEALEEEKRGIQADITEVYKEAKDAGFDTKIMRMLVKERRMSVGERAEVEALLDTYRHALGMLADTPLGSAAIARAGGGQIDIEDAIKAAPTAGEEEPQGVGDLVPGQDVGALFSLMEAQPLEANGEQVRAWRLLHKGAEVFAPVGDQQFVQECVDQLNDAVHVDGSDLSIKDIRSTVARIIGMYASLDRPVAPLFTPPYDADEQPNGEQQDEPAAEGAKRGPKTAAEKLAAYFDGYDQAQGGASIDTCPFKRGALKDEWQLGWSHAKDGKAPSYVRPTPPAANDDSERPLFGEGPQGQDVQTSAA